MSSPWMWMWPLMLLACSACAHAPGRFESNRFQSEDYPYAVWYAGGSPEALLGRDWMLANYERVYGRWETKKGGRYEVTRRYPVEGREMHELVPRYELLYTHRSKEAQLWIRAVPITPEDAALDLSQLAERYVTSVSKSGLVDTDFGAELDGPLQKGVHETRTLSSFPCQVTKKEALRVDFEVARAAKEAQAGGWQRAAVALTRPGYLSRVPRDTATRSVLRPVLILIGLSGPPEDFAGLEPYLDNLLSQLVLSDRNRGLPLKGEHSCRLEAETATSGGSQDAAAAP